MKLLTKKETSQISAGHSRYTILEGVRNNCSTKTAIIACTTIACLACLATFIGVSMKDDRNWS